MASLQLPIFPKPGTKAALDAASRVQVEVGNENMQNATSDDLLSLTSVARRAQDAAKKIFEAGYQALAKPAEDLTLDTRELLTPVGTQIEIAKATIKLESMAHTNMVVTLAILYFAATISLILAIVLGALASQSTMRLSDVMASFAIEGVARTLAVLMILFLFLFFPFRVIQYSMKTGGVILPEQLLLIILIVIIMITPGMSVFSPYVFWDQYSQAYKFSQDLPDDYQLSAGNAFVMHFFSSDGKYRVIYKMTSIFSIIIIFFGALYVGWTTHVFGQPVKALKYTGTHSKPEGFDEEEQNPWRPAFDDRMNVTCQETFFGCCGSIRELLVDSHKRILLVCTAYLIMSLSLVIIYDFMPSQVPFVGMITVLRVCPQVTISLDNPLNLTNCDPSLQDGTPFSRAMSVMAQFIIELFVVLYVNKITSRTTQKLKTLPYETNRSKHLGFRYFSSNKRMTLFFMLLCSIIVTAVSSTLLNLYVVSRTDSGTFSTVFSPLKQVGINFYGLGFGSFYLLLACFLFAFANAYLPPDSAPGIRSFFCGGHTVIAKRDLDHPTYILRETDILVLRKSRNDAYNKMQKIDEERRKHLADYSSDPSWSQKRRQLFNAFISRPHADTNNDTGKRYQQPRSDDHESMAPSSLDNQGGNIPAGLTNTEKLQRFFGLTKQLCPIDKAAEQYERLAALLRPKSHSVSEHMSADEPSAIVEQVNANIFCIETEILLLNLSFITYAMGSYNDEVPLTNEQKQDVIGKDSRYRLVSHIENALTDIQACIFTDDEDEQRIYVCFRGTSTSKNIWQDLDYVQVPHPSTKDVEPFLKKPDDLIAKAAAMQVPRVHRGFYLAYESVQEAVLSVVSDLVESRPNGCVVFTCGHSLGGALATHFALDIGLKHKLFESNMKGIQVSTFGSPRVGNFSYVCRHRRIVPTTHRFCIGGDPVPKLPPAQLFSEFTKWGYHHIGVEILLDVEKVNLLLGPLFIERQMQHGWGGYVPRNHSTSSYVLALALWCARVHHSSAFVPEWWLPVINHLLKVDRVRIAKVLETKPQLGSSIADQMTSREGAILWTDDSRALMNRGCDSSFAGSHTIDAPSSRDSVQLIHQVLASCGILSRRQERVNALFSSGYRDKKSLRMMKVEDFKKLNQSYGSDLFNDDFIKLFMNSYSSRRCEECDFAPLHCPRCTELNNIDLV